MRVLAVEDDEGISAGLTLALRREGWAVDVAAGVSAAWNALTAEPFDMVLLDLGLADGDGAEVLRRLRQPNRGRLPDPATPVLIMTARDEVASRIGGLDLGADDYVTKPFATDELLARIRALTRRTPPADTDPVVRFANVTIDLNARRVTKVDASGWKLIPVKDVGELLAVAGAPEQRSVRIAARGRMES